MKVKFTKQAIKELKKIKKSDQNLAKRVKEVTNKLSSDGPYGEKLQANAEFLKIRVGKYRIIHTVLDDSIVVAIIEKIVRQASIKLLNTYLQNIVQKLWN